MRVLVACEFSGIVRNAFSKKGHDSWSCDLLPTEQFGNHIIGNVLDYLNESWDLMIAHPPCTYLSSSGARWHKDRQNEQAAAIDFVIVLLNAPIPRIAIENPIGILSSRLWKPDQILQPHRFGHAESKATCLWLQGVPPLRATKIISLLEVKDRVHKEAPSPDRWKNRSRTYSGIADAMAEQWQ